MSELVEHVHKATELIFKRKGYTNCPTEAVVELVLQGYFAVKAACEIYDKEAHETSIRQKKNRTNKRVQAKE
jgi:hypothetical protein